MQKYRNCKNCNTTFVLTYDTALCRNCELDEEELCQRMREYFDVHPQADIPELSVRFGISANRIQEFIRSDKLNF